MLKNCAKKLKRRNYIRSQYSNPISVMRARNILLKIKWCNALVLYQIAVTKLKKLDFTGALADLNQVISLDPNLAIAYYCRSIAKFELGDYQGSIAFNSKAISIEPTFV